ncbi:MAG: hypothetical protein QOI13_2954 [Paraburkholderia sp.]|jgi:surface antigen|nr:hypothetical protein [Paraburkholderia sp.]
MRNLSLHGAVLAAGLVCAACAAAQTYDRSTIDTSTCRIVSGQSEIDGALQPFVGQACLQPNGVWVFVSGNGSYVAPVATYGYYGGPWYYGEPWVWGPPVFIGTSVVFVDHFHHRHHFDHFHGRDRIPSAGHPSGMHPWGMGHGWAGGMRRH